MPKLNDDGSVYGFWWCARLYIYSEDEGVGTLASEFPYEQPWYDFDAPEVYGLAVFI